MRKLNIYIVAGILVCFIAHAIAASMGLMGAYGGSLKILAKIAEGLIYVHIILTFAMGYETLKARKLSGAGYFRGNGLFWARRISGLFILIPLIMHFEIFGTSNQGAYRLEVFNTGRLISQIMLIAAIALHLFINLRPLMISLGVREYRAFKIDALLILSVLMLFFGIAFVIYYIRWISF